MTVFTTILFTSYFFDLSFAFMKKCSEENDQIELCLLGDKYVDPNNLNTVEFDTQIYIEDIIEIDISRNDITVILELWSYWLDPGLALTNESV